MRRDNNQQKIALAVGIALSAGMFSIMPSAAAAPELDHVVSGEANVVQNSNVTDITSTSQNNVIDWKTFSVAQGETVRFDNGNKTNNYLNVVTGGIESQIDGNIIGGNEVYIVNPNGVIFGKDASVDVGSLYVSTESATTAVAAASNMGSSPTAVLQAGTANADVVNMGTINATNVQVVGKNIKFTDVSQVKASDVSQVTASDVTLKASGSITLGGSVTDLLATKDNTSTTDVVKVYKNTVGAEGKVKYDAAINDTGEWKKLPKLGYDKDNTYVLTNNLDFSADTTYKPIGDKTTPFTGTFDGGYHKVSGINVSGYKYGGLFGYALNATIKNVGVSGGQVNSIANESSEDYVGGIVGYAKNTDLINVFNEGTTIVANYDDEDIGGGIVGLLDGGKINTAYNTADIEGYKKVVGGIIGIASGTVHIDNVYNTGVISNNDDDGVNRGRAIIAKTKSDDDTVYLNNAYSTTCDLYNADGLNNFYHTNAIEDPVSDDKVHETDYTGKLAGVSKEGGLSVTASPWRIYEGQSLPLLRAFLTGHGTVNVNYNYTQGKNTGSRNGQDLTVAYNGNDIKLSNVSYTKDGAAFTPTSGIITAPTKDVISGDITATNYDTSTGKVRTLAAFYTGQQGYDLVGNNYTINQKPVTIDSGTVSTAPYSREYNGTNDAADAIKNFSYGGTNGIVAADLTNGKVSLNTSNVNAYFVGAAGNTTDADAPDVGGNKTIAVIGSVTLTNGSGYYNYKLSGSSASIGTADNPFTFSGNSITQKSVEVNLNNATGINKGYDGKTKVLDTFKPSAQIASTVTGLTTGSGDSAVTQTISLTYAADAHYVDSNDSPTKMAGTYTNKVKYGGIKITGVSNGSTKNYKLVNADGQTIYSEAVTYTDGNGVEQTMAGTGVNASSGGSLYGSGNINKKSLSSTGFSWYEGDTAKTATKEYDGSTGYTAPEGKIVKNDALAAMSDKIYFTVKSADFVTSPEGSLDTNNHHRTATPTKNAGTAKGVLYTVSITGDDAVNYTLDGATINTTNNGTNTVIGAGSIMPRTINLLANTASGAKVEKTYDGNSTVTKDDVSEFYLLSNSSTLNNNTDFLVYSGDDDHKLLTDDTDAKIKITGKYVNTNSEGAANVNYDTTNNTVADKNIVYTAEVMEGDNPSSNYKFAVVNDTVQLVNDKGTKATFTADSMGKIKQRDITNITFKDVSKTYDGSNAVRNTTNYDTENTANPENNNVTFKANDRITITGVLLANGTNALVTPVDDEGNEGEADTIDTIFNTTNGQIAEGTGTPENPALITGKYGTADVAADGTVSNWHGNEHAAAGKVVQYTINGDLLKTDNHNYKLALTDNVVYDLADDGTNAGGSEITPLSLSAAEIGLARTKDANGKLVPITKTYNGYDTVDNAGSYISGIYASKDGVDLDLTDAVEIVKANYATKHSGNGSNNNDSISQGVTYTLKIGNGNADYTVSGADSEGQFAKTKDIDGVDIKGVITPKIIKVTENDIVNNDEVVNKVYDATVNVNGTGEDLVGGINDQILPIDKNNTNPNEKIVNDTAAVYVNDQGTPDKNVAIDGDNVINKGIVYTLGLTNNAYNDYVFRDNNGNAISNNQLTGEGMINKRSLSVSVTLKPEKVYDGKPDVLTMPANLPDADTGVATNADITFGTTDDNIVVMSDGFIIGELTGKYGIKNGNVFAEDSNVNRVNKDVQYTGVLAALGDNAANYEVDDKAYGFGIINPQGIDHNVFKLVLKDGITQTYSGSAIVGEYGMNDEQKDAFQRGWIDKDKSGIYLSGNTTEIPDISLNNNAYTFDIEDSNGDNSAKFNTADAGNRTVTYTIHIKSASLTNYEYVDENVAIDSIYTSDDANGTIKARPVTVTVTNPTLSKYYDGTTKIYNDSNASWSGEVGTVTGAELKGADAVTMQTAVGEQNADGSWTETGLISGYGTNASSGEYTGTDVGTETITYTPAVSGVTAGNYKFVDENGVEISASNNPLQTTGNTIKPFGVVVTAADTNKVYDGDTALDSVETEAKTKAQTALQLGHNYDTDLALSNITADTGVYDNPNVNNGAAHKVTYTGFTLNNDNYYLADANGKPIATDNDGKNVITGKGYITKYTLTALPTFTIHDVTKEYDTDALVKYNRSSNADDIKRNFITATNLPGDIAYELVKAEYTDSARGVGKTVNFILQLSSDNYNFGSLVNNGLMNADGTFAKSGTGDITPRKVYVSLDTTPEIKKTYDGDADVEQDVTNMIIVRDGDLLNDGTRLNRNASVINAQYEDKDAGDDKTVTYQVRLTGNGADNYEIHRLENLGTNADNVCNTLEGTGKIDKAALTFNPYDHAFDRDYRKGDAKVGLNTGSVVLTGVNGETVTLNDGALKKVTAEFGKGTGANDFTADENVSWNGNNVVDKDIRFTGLDNALKYMVDNQVDAISKNYTIDGTAYFAAAKAKGKIKPITITQAATENWKAVTREYNADTDLQEVYDYSGATAEPLGINDILTFTLTHDGNTVTDSNGNALTVTYTAAGKYDNQNVGDNHTLNYHINSVETKVKDAAGNANYILDDSVLTALVNHDVDSGAANNAGNAAVYSHITPRQLNAAVVKDSGNRKIYDGNDRADTSNFVVDADDQAILSKDGLLNDVVITARYGDKHASVNPGEADSNSKTITYTLALNDNSGNYAIATPSAAAQGDIERRKVYVDGTNAVAAPKDYDGNTDLPSGTDYNAMGFGLRDADSTTGLVTGDSDLKLDATQVEGHYVSPDVKRATDGSVIAQNINFSGFKLNDTDSTNDNSINDYVVIDAGGSGVIKPLPVSVSIAAAPYKVYDGTTTVKGTAAANANLVPSGLLTGDSANILIGSADYDDASAGTNKGYTYNITLGNGNYTLVQGSNAPDITVTGNGLKGQIKASDGTIDKRTITPTVNGIMTKVYDGTTAGTENAAASVSLSNVVSGDNVGLTAKAVYDNPNAGTAEDSDGLQNHKVTYKLNLSNPNYQLAEDTITGTGTISRKGLTIVATPVSINSGEAMPKFSGTVEGLVSGDENLASSFVFDTIPTVTNTSVEKPNPVYGWYRNQTSGNFGLNYTFDQDAANDTAFTVKYVDSGRNNPDTKITPTHNVYQQISKDKGSGFGDNAAAALEYVDKNGQVIGRENINSGEIHDGSVSLGNADDMTSQDTSLANIGIVGGDIVNVDGADAANMANIEVTDNGTTVNLEITSLSSGESGDKQAVAEITSVPAAADNSSAQIQNLDDRQDILEQLENKDKDEEKKDSEIAIESQNNQNDDEIELKIEGSGVKVA